MLTSYDVTRGRFVVSLEQGVKVSVRPQSIQVVDDQLAVSAAEVRQEEARREARTDDLLFSSAQLLRNASRSPSPAVKLLLSRGGRHTRSNGELADEDYGGNADKERPPRQQLTPWESAQASNLSRSPLLRRTQWPPRPSPTPAPTGTSGESLSRGLEPPRAKVGEALPPQDPRSVMDREAGRLWKEAGMPYDGGVC